MRGGVSGARKQVGHDTVIGRWGPIVVVLAFTGWGVLAYVITGLVFAVLFLASFIANRRANPR